MEGGRALELRRCRLPGEEGHDQYRRRAFVTHPLPLHLITPHREYKQRLSINTGRGKKASVGVGRPEKGGRE